MRFLTQSLSVAIAIIITFSCHLKTAKTVVAAVALVASLLKPSLCFFFSEVSPVSLPSICNLM